MACNIRKYWVLVTIIALCVGNVVCKPAIKNSNRNSQEVNSVDDAASIDEKALGDLSEDSESNEEIRAEKTFAVREIKSDTEEVNSVNADPSTDEGALDNSLWGDTDDNEEIGAEDENIDSNDLSADGVFFDAADWVKEAEQWSFKGGDWGLVTLPNDDHPDIPTPPVPGPVLIAEGDSMRKVIVSRNEENLENLTLHFSYFLSNNPQNPPVLEVYQIQDDTNSERVSVETTYGQWTTSTVSLPYSGNFEIKFIGQRIVDTNEIALDDIMLRGYYMEDDMGSGDVSIEEDNEDSDDADVDSGDKDENGQNDKGDQDADTEEDENGVIYGMTSEGGDQDVVDDTEPGAEEETDNQEVETDVLTAEDGDLDEDKGTPTDEESNPSIDDDNQSVEGGDQNVETEVLTAGESDQNVENNNDVQITDNENQDQNEETQDDVADNKDEDDGTEEDDDGDNQEAKDDENNETTYDDEDYWNTYSGDGYYDDYDDYDNGWFFTNWLNNNNDDDNPAGENDSPAGDADSTFDKIDANELEEMIDELEEIEDGYTVIMFWSLGVIGFLLLGILYWRHHNSAWPFGTGERTIFNRATAGQNDFDRLMYSEVPYDDDGSSGKNYNSFEK